MIDPIAIQELNLFIDHDSHLYQRVKKPIFDNLQKHVNKGRFCKERATVSTMRLVEEGAKKYVKDYCSAGAKWYQMFHMNDRKELAALYVDEFVTEYMQSPSN